MAEATGVMARHIPFGGANPAITAVIGGHVDAVVAGPGEMQVQRDAGNLKILGVMSKDRLGLFPDVPTFRETGYDVILGTWRGLAVPAGTPKTAQDKLSAAFLEAVTDLEFIEFARRGGLNIKLAEAGAFRGAIDILMNTNPTNKLIGILLSFGLTGTLTAQNVVPETSPLSAGPAAALAYAHGETRLEDFVHPPVNFQPGPEYGPDQRNYQGIPGIERAPGGGSGRRGTPARCGRTATTMWSPPPAAMTAKRGATSSLSLIPTATAPCARPTPASGSIPTGASGSSGGSTEPEISPL
jgi:hypothetical protein